VNRSRSAIAVVAALWLAGVVFMAIHHELWRDEVRALSIVREAARPFDLVALTRNEGHPLLWYLLLYAGNQLTSSPIVLQAVSIAVAFAAVWYFLWRAPFPLWVRCLFIFGALPFFDYSVLARNYGISMLLLFVAAGAYPERWTRPLRLGLALALLANTNIHSAMLAGIVAVLWASDLVPRGAKAKLESWAPVLAGFLAVAAGILVSVATVIPDADSAVFSKTFLNARDVAMSAAEVLASPGTTFSTLMPPEAPSWAAGVFLWIALGGLLVRPKLFVAGLAAMLSLGVFFHVIYGGGLRHHGLFFVFLVFLYWLLLDSADARQFTGLGRALFVAGFCGALVVLLIGQVEVARRLVARDYAGQASSAKAFGEFLAASPGYRDAVIVPEPDYLLESLPYYAGNRIYLAREHRFGTTTSFTTKSDRILSIGLLIAKARLLKRDTRKPVLVVLGHPEVGGDARQKIFSYNKIFRWSEEEMEAFNSAVWRVASFHDAYGDENYDVYAVR
jgi:hypothetical protein